MDKTFEAFQAALFHRCGRARFTSWEISWFWNRSKPFRGKEAKCFLIRNIGEQSYRNMAKLNWFEAYWLNEDKNLEIAWVCNQGYVMDMAYNSRFDPRIKQALGWVG